MNEPLDYRKDAARKDQIVIDRFDDGGVTITIPPAASFKRPGAVVCAAAVIGGLFAVEFWLMWRLGYSVRSVALDLQRTEKRFRHRIIPTVALPAH